MVTVNRILIVKKMLTDKRILTVIKILSVKRILTVKRILLNYCSYVYNAKRNGHYDFHSSWRCDS